jgi:phosphoglycolate phosphatase
MLVEFGRTPLPVSRIAGMIGHGIERLVEGALGASAGDAVQLDLAFALFRRCYAERLFVESRVYPGVTEGLAALEAQGVPCCCITNKPGVFALPLLEAAGLAGGLAFTLCADSPRLRKPAPDLLLDACLRLGLAPAQMLFVGDSSLDIEAARAAGCPVALVSYGYRRGVDSGVARPDWIIGNLVELSALPAPGDRANLGASRS